MDGKRPCIKPNTLLGPETLSDREFFLLPDREHFLWNQQRYILENIKLADTKAGFVITIACAGLSALLGRGLAGPVVSFGKPFLVPFLVMTSALTVAGVAAMLAAIAFGAWSIKPRIGASQAPSAVSWTHIARYSSLEGFQEASAGLTVEAANDGLAEQVFYLSRICHRKHGLIARAIVLATCGGFCLALAVLLRHLALHWV